MAAPSMQNEQDVQVGRDELDRKLKVQKEAIDLLQARLEENTHVLQDLEIELRRQSQAHMDRERQLKTNFESMMAQIESIKAQGGNMKDEKNEKEMESYRTFVRETSAPAQLEEKAGRFNKFAVDGDHKMLKTQAIIEDFRKRLDTSEKSTQQLEDKVKDHERRFEDRIFVPGQSEAQKKNNTFEERLNALETRCGDLGGKNIALEDSPHWPRWKKLEDKRVESCCACFWQIFVPIGKRNIKALGWPFLEKALCKTRMRELNFDCSGINDEGAKIFAKALADNEKIESLSLFWNHITNDGAVILAQAIHVNTSLKSVDLSMNYFGDIGKNALLKAKEAREKHGKPFVRFTL